MRSSLVLCVRRAALAAPTRMVAARGMMVFRFNAKAPDALQRAMELGNLRETEVMLLLEQMRGWSPEAETLLTEKVDLASFSKQGLFRSLVLATVLRPSPTFVTHMVTMLRMEVPRRMDLLEARDILFLFKAFNNCRLTVDDADFAELLKLVTPIMARLAVTMDGMMLANLIYWLYRFKVRRDVHIPVADYKVLFMALVPRMHELKSAHWLRVISTDTLQAMDIGHAFFDAYKRVVQPALPQMSGPDLVLLVRWLALLRAGTQYLDELFFMAWAGAITPKMHEPRTDSLSGLLVSLSILNLNATVVGADVFRAWAAEMAARKDLNEQRVMRALQSLSNLGLNAEIMGPALGPHFAQVFVGSKLKEDLYAPGLKLLGVTATGKATKPAPNAAAAKN